MKGLSKSCYTAQHLGNGKGLGTSGAASAEPSLIELCRVVTDEDKVKNRKKKLESSE